MQSIDYGDLNKFLVSIGIILIGLAILIPYFYLKEDFGLYLETTRIESFQEPTKQLITSRQELVFKIQRYIPCVSISLILLGLTSTTIGLYRWFGRQKKLDEKIDIEIEKLKLDLENQTPEETRSVAATEAKEIELETQFQSQNKLSSSDKIEGLISGKTEVLGHLSGSLFSHEELAKLSNEYMEITALIIGQFENSQNTNFEILPNQKIGKKFYIDIILKSKTRKYSDRIVEIKYFRSTISSSILKRTLYQLTTYITFYKQATKNNAIPVFIIVYDSRIISHEQIVDSSTRIYFNAKGIPELRRLIVEFIPQEEINNFDVYKVMGPQQR